jgi:hypothetical protein
VKRHLPLIVLIIGIAIAASASADTVISKDVQEIVQKIAGFGRMNTSNATVTFKPSPESMNIQQLRKKATTEELRILTDNPNPVIRCCAFWALTRDSAEGIFELVVRHIQDTASVLNYYDGDETTQPVGDFYIGLVNGYYGEICGDSSIRRKLTAIERHRLDSVLIVEPNNLLSKAWAVRNAEPLEWMYPRIRELVQKEKYHPALVPLAKYHREQDVSLISELIKTSRPDTSRSASDYMYDFWAIGAFPHPAFLPLLEDKLNESLDSMEYYKNPLYDAIAAYQNADAVRLFGIACTTPKDWRVRSGNCCAALQSIEKFLGPVYDSLLFDFWDTRQLINSQLFEYLARADSGRTLELARISLKYPYDIWKANTISQFDAGENVLSDMIDYVMKRDSAFAMKAVRDGLYFVSTEMYFTFVRAAKQYRDSSFVEPLFRSFGTAGNWDYYLKAADALLAYSDTTVDRRLKELTRSDERLKNGRGAKSLKAMLKERGIK